MTKRLLVSLVALAAVPTALLAQAAAPASENPISDSQKRIYVLLSATVISAAEKMPEESYFFKPTPDVRSFGQLVGHLADSQYYFCSLASGETMPPSSAEKSKTQKADLVAALKDAVAYCTTQYAAMTDAKAAQMTKLMNLDVARATVLTGNFAHIYEHYGNMSTYMRIRGILPPSSEKRPVASQE